MIFKNNIFFFALLLSAILIGCADKEEIYLDPPPPLIENTDSLSLIIKKNTGLIKHIEQDTTFSNFEGLEESYISYINQKDKPITLYLLQIDLTNPALSIRVATPNNEPTANSTQRMSDMITAKNNSSSDLEVLSAINGDYFDWPGIPLGPVHQGGVPIRTHMSSGYKYFGLLTNNSYVVGDNSEYLAYQDKLTEVIGGRHLLLKNGEVINQTDVSVAPRTSIGVINTKKVVMMVVDGRQNHSVGYSLEEEAETLKALGVKDAVNLDGGGSSVFITKNEKNEYQVRNKVSDGSERAVANGLFVIRKKN